MKALILTTLVVLSSWANAAQVYGEAQLLKIDSEFGFKTAENVKLSVIADKDNTPIAMELTWDLVNAETEEVTEKSQYVVVHSIQATSEGKVISAHLPQKHDSRHIGPSMGARFNIQLIDHSDAVITIPFENLWEVTVNSGYGWCGTGDARMNLVGNPL